MELQFIPSWFIVQTLLYAYSGKMWSRLWLVHPLILKITCVKLATLHFYFVVDIASDCLFWINTYKILLIWESKLLIQIWLYIFFEFRRQCLLHGLIQLSSTCILNFSFQSVYIFLWSLTGKMGNQNAPYLIKKS